MSNILLMILLFVSQNVSATRIRNKSGIAISIIVANDFNRALAYSPDLIELSPDQEAVVSLPKATVVTLTMLYRGSDPRYSGLRMEYSYPVWRWGVPESIDIYLDLSVDEEKLGSVPQRAYQFALDTTRLREGRRKKIE